MSGAKGIAKAIKEKALKRVRWYCQLCEKQCRDQNGYDMHMSSQGHKNKLMKVGEQGERQLVQVHTEKFQEGFMQILRSRYQVRVLANRVYNEYIQDRHHVHMNSTKFRSLSAFVEHLRQTGVCLVEDEPEGPYVTYQADRDPNNTRLFLSRKKEKRLRSESLDDAGFLHDQAKRHASSVSAGPDVLSALPLCPSTNPLLAIGGISMAAIPSCSYAAPSDLPSATLPSSLEVSAAHVELHQDQPQAPPSSSSSPPAMMPTLPALPALPAFDPSAVTTRPFLEASIFLDDE